MRADGVLKAGIVLGLIPILTGCQFGGDLFTAKFERSEELTAPLGQASAIDVDTNVGKIHLEAANVDEVRILAAIRVKAGTEERAEELARDIRIVAQPNGQTLAVKAVRPSGMDREQLSVGFTIAAPASLAVKARTNVGDIHVAGFGRGVDTETGVGKITVTDLRDSTQAHTNVGDIRIIYASDAPATLEVRATTNVGDIDFAGPSQISAGVSAEANVGSIDTDRPLTVKGSMKKSIKGQFGDGRGRIELRTNVGSIDIR